MEAYVALVPAPDFKSGGSRGDTASAGSIPVRFRQDCFSGAGSEPIGCLSLVSRARLFLNAYTC